MVLAAVTEMGVTGALDSLSILFAFSFLSLSLSFYIYIFIKGNW